MPSDSAALVDSIPRQMDAGNRTFSLRPSCIKLLCESTASEPGFVLLLPPENEPVFPYFDGSPIKDWYVQTDRRRNTGMLMKSWSA